MALSLESYLKYQQTFIDKCLKHHHGYELMWVGEGDQSLAHKSPVCHQFKAGFGPDESAGVVINESRLHFEDGSLDVIVLNHFLERYRCFEDFIKEAHRVLRHDGKLLITGFNPYRLRASALFNQMTDCQYKNERYFRSLSRLRKQIEPFGFGLHRHYYFGFSNSTSREMLYRKCIPGISVGYVLLLEKRTIKLTPLDMGWTGDTISDSGRLRLKPILKPTLKPSAKPIARGTNYEGIK